MHCSWFVFFVSFLALTMADVCTRLDSETDITKGYKPDIDFVTFSADVEIYKKEYNSIVSMKLYYDALSQTVRLTLLQNSNERDLFFLFATNELLTFEPSFFLSRGICTVDSNMTENARLYMIGGPNIDPASGKNRVPKASSVFHFTGKDAANQDIVQQFVGKTKIRGKDVYQFKSCQQWMHLEDDFEKFTAQVTHYFTGYQDTKNWKYPDTSAVPVAMHVVGQISSGVTIDQTWNFFNVKQEATYSFLETPPGVVCPGRKNSYYFPALPTFVKLTYEVIDNVNKRYQTLNEIYDQFDKFSVLRTTKAAGLMNPADSNVTINDFNSGLSYKIDEVTKRCSIRNISDIATPFAFTDKGQALEMSPAMFFMAKDAKYTYLGKRKIRGIPCDTWVANTYNKFLKNVTAEWYFAPQAVDTWNSASDENDVRIPMQCRIWPGQSDFSDPRAPVTYYDINVYHVDYTKVLLNAVSIKPCLTSSPSNVVQITFPNAGGQIRGNFNYQERAWNLLLQIAQVAQVSWLRISDFRLTSTDRDAVATFELLDAPPYRGNVKDWTPPTSLAQAIKALQNNPQKSIWYDATPFNSTYKLYFYASSNPSFQSPTESKSYYHTGGNDSGYSGGAMAGLGVAMMAVGVASGGGVIYYFLCKRGL